MQRSVYHQDAQGELTRLEGVCHAVVTCADATMIANFVETFITGDWFPDFKIEGKLDILLHAVPPFGHRAVRWSHTVNGIIVYIIIPHNGAKNKE